MNNVVQIKTTHSVGVDGSTIFHNRMANAKISFFLFFLRKQCALKTKQNVFLEKETQQKSETETGRQKREKKSWAKPNLSQVIIVCGFSPEIQKSIFNRV